MDNFKPGLGHFEAHAFHIDLTQYVGLQALLILGLGPLNGGDIYALDIPIGNMVQRKGAKQRRKLSGWLLLMETSVQL